ncbi:MAG: hypothetical protein HOW73_21745 [Polyangiaceae bacterium]|nr:hypothetical protein [Polyangiaceae bacterium]
MTMTDTCKRPWVAAAWALFIVLAATGCDGCDDDDDDAGGGGNGGDGGGGAEGGGQQAGGGGDQGGGGSTAVASFNEVTQTTTTPFDATPNPAGDRIYFTASGPDLAGVYAVSATGGGITAVAEGFPFATPLGIATSTDGDTLYVADPAADDDDLDGGKIFSLNADGGAALVVEGAERYKPLGLEVFDDDGSDEIYFSGTDPDTNERGIFHISASGGAVESVVTNTTMDPSGIAVAKNGDIYFVDTVGSAARLGRVMKIAVGTTQPLVLLDDIHTGYPAGIALSADDDQLWVSALDPATLTDVVLNIDIADMAVSTVTGDDDTSITSFFESAGIHRAKNANVFSFVDSLANGQGTIFAASP